MTTCKASWLVLAAATVTVAVGAATPPRHAAVARPAATPEAIAAALADPARADQASDDVRRKAAEVIAFSGVGPGAEAVDFLPGSGYWTRILTGIVGPAGHVYAIWPGGAEKYSAKALPALQARGLANVTAEQQATPLPAVPHPVDLFLTVQNYHDVPATMIGAFNRAVYATLKPGGTYLVIDHADSVGAVPTTPFKHRIDPHVVKAQVIAAGFRFVAESSVLANPADDHSKIVFDPAIRGNTDQFVFRFRKPG